MFGKKATTSTATRRTLCLHGTFMPPGTNSNADIGPTIQFLELFIEARDLQLKHRQRELVVRKQAFRKQAPLMPKVGDVLQKYLSGGINAQQTARRINKICPDKKTARALLDFFSSPPCAASTTKSQVAKQKTDIARAEEVLRALKRASRNIEFLGTKACEGEADAIRNLVDIGQQIVNFLLLAKRTHPETALMISRGEVLWPVLIHSKSPDEASTTRQLEGLELGKDLEPFQARFRSARGPDENYPARQWAKAAVRTLEETRWRFFVYGGYRAEFEKMILNGSTGLPKIPKWAGAACALPSFSKDTASAWGRVIRDMIRDQIPDFDSRREWENQRNTGRHSGRNSRGEIRNAILDDIVSALLRIAPSAHMLKSTS